MHASLLYVFECMSVSLKIQTSWTPPATPLHDNYNIEWQYYIYDDLITWTKKKLITTKKYNFSTQGCLQVWTMEEETNPNSSGGIFFSQRVQVLGTIIII